MAAALITDILSSYRNSLGKDYDKYHNHCQRVYHFAEMLLAPTPQEAQQLAIAAAFHDLGIWTANTFNYLEPSVELAKIYLDSEGLKLWENTIINCIKEHHKLSSYTGNQRQLVEAFRKADLIDLSYGLIRFHVPKRFFKKQYNSFPPKGFHRKIAGLAFKELFINPANPLPMVKW